MQRFCTECQALVQAQFLCPKCGAQTVEVDEPADAVAGPVLADPLAPPSFWSRLTVGLLVAQGLYFGCWQFLTAGALALDEPTLRSASTSTAWLQGLAALTLFVGSVITGAGLANGLVAGVVLGASNAALTLLIPLGIGRFEADPAFYGPPLVQILIGAFGGWLGSRVWHPLSAIPLALPSAPGPSGADPAFAGLRSAARPVGDTDEPFQLAWVRILLGAGLALGAAFAAGNLRDFGLNLFLGRGAVDRAQLYLVAWQIGLLALLFGGGLAGASTGAGGRHGLMAGTLAAVGLALLYTARELELLPAHQFLAAQMGQDPPGGKPIPAVLGVVVGQTILVGWLAGWFGGLLLPRMPDAPRKRLDRGAI